MHPLRRRRILWNRRTNAASNSCLPRTQFGSVGFDRRVAGEIPPKFDAPRQLPWLCVQHASPRWSCGPDGTLLECPDRSECAPPDGCRFESGSGRGNRRPTGLPARQRESADFDECGRCLVGGHALLQLLERHSLGLRHDLENPDQLEHHHARVERERVAAGNFRDHREGPRDQRREHPVREASQCLPLGAD